MSNKSKAIGAASVLAAGVGAAAYLTAKKKQGDKAADSKKASSNNGYRNTELGKYEKNSKGIYYSNGNYEAFARPEKPEGVDEKNAYLVGLSLIHI